MSADSTALHVADILAAAPPTLQQRARHAAQEAYERAQYERQLKTDDLLAEFLEFCTDVLLLTPDELEFVVANHDVLTNEKLPTITVTLDGVALRARYETKKIADIKSSEFNPTPIFEDVLRVDAARASRSSFKQVTSLADVGRILS